MDLLLSMTHAVNSLRASRGGGKATLWVDVAVETYRRPDWPRTWVSNKKGWASAARFLRKQNGTARKFDNFLNLAESVWLRPVIFRGVVTEYFTG